VEERQIQGHGREGQKPRMNQPGTDKEQGDSRIGGEDQPEKHESRSLMPPAKAMSRCQARLRRVSHIE